MAERPNIVLVLCDDMGFSDVGCFGSEVPTPHIDDLAHRGIRLTQMYNSARCCPSRASLLTGLFPTQAGVGHMTETGCDLPGYEGRLTDRCVTIAEVLRDAGYRTGMVGKWHVGGPLLGGAPVGEADPVRNPRPTDRGFERFFGTMLGAGSYYRPASLTEGVDPFEPDEGFYYTDAIGDRAVAMIDELGGGAEPFLLYVSHVAPHWPLHALAEDIEPFLGTYVGGWDAVRATRHERLRGLGLVDASWGISTRDERARDWATVEEKAFEDARMAVYAAQVVAVDRSVGRITSKLRSLGIGDDTLVLFLSDNGGCAEILPGNFDPSVLPGPPGTFTSYGLPWAMASNAPFSHYKRWVHEGGISTPFVACWPAGIPAGAIAHDPVHVVDLMATVIELAGARYPADSVTPLEGQSMVALLRGRQSARTGPICFEHEGNRAVRDGELKLVAAHGQPWELYRMDSDRTETDDLAAQYPGEVARLAALHDDWSRRTGALPWDEALTRLPYWVGTNPPEG